MLRIWRVTAFRGHEAVLFQCVCTCVVSVYVVVWFQCNVVMWFQCMWWCGFGVCGGVVSVYVAVWFQCMWRCGFSVSGGVVSVYVTV